MSEPRDAMIMALVRARPCAKCRPGQPCEQCCLIKVALHQLSEFREFQPEAELEAPPDDQVVWQYWNASFERHWRIVCRQPFPRRPVVGLGRYWDVCAN
jgi:hypothetical protein